MRYLIAILFPVIAFFLMGKLFQGFLCLFLQLTMIGWIPAAVWAVLSTNKYYEDRRHKEIMNKIS